MKLSLKVEDQHQNGQSRQKQHHIPILLRAKVPITVFGLPFLSGVSATDSSDPSLSLRTNFASGPSLKLSYTPNSTSTVAAATSALSVTLKSGVSLFGSPRDSPLVISAHFAVSPQNPNPIPTFSLQIKPQFGDFSLRKTTYSSPNPSPTADCDANSMGFVPLQRPMAWKDLSIDSPHKDSVFSGIAIKAKTMLPLTKQLAMNFRWGVNLPTDIRKQLPFLTVNKIGIERIVEVKEVKEAKAVNCEVNVAELDPLKSFCLSIKREVEVLQKENREMRHSLEDMRIRTLRGQGWTCQGHNEGVAKKALPVNENSGEFEQWKTKKSGREENGRKESKKNANAARDLENELQRAIKASSS